MEHRSDDSRNTAPGAGTPLGIDHFNHRVGQSFPVDAGGVGFKLTLVATQEIPRSPREGGGFRLEFEGPTAPVLPQAIHSFALDDERHDIFIVPLGPGVGGKISYEAIFF